MANQNFRLTRRRALGGAVGAALAGGLLGGAGIAGAAVKKISRGDAPAEASMLIVNGLDTSVLNDEYVRMLKTGGVSCCHFSVGGVSHLAGVYRFVDSRKDVVVARSVQDIRAAHAHGRLSLVFGWQSADELGTDFISPMFGPPRTALRAYYELGLRIVGIAYNLANVFGGGNLDDVPLSRAGRVLVEEIHSTRMLLDVGGHTGEQTSLDAIAMSAGRPVICSHANIKSITDNVRNVSDRLIDAIAATGGVIGLSALNDFHVRDSQRDLDKASLPLVGVDALVDQIDYLRKRVGIDHVGIGPDFVHGRSLDYDTINSSLAINRAVLSDGEWPYIQGFESVDKLPAVTQEMRRRGWAEANIRKVLGENWLRVYQQAWGA